MAMQQYFAMEPLECNVVKEEMAKLQAERNSEPVQQQYAMLGALKVLDANCCNMFKKFGMLTYSTVVQIPLLQHQSNLWLVRTQDQVWYHFTQQVVALNKKRFGKADDPTAVDNDIPVDALDSQIQLSKNANVLTSGRHDTKVPWTVLSQHCKEVVMADYLLTAPMFKFRQLHNMSAELANEWYDILLAKQEIEQPFKFRAYYNMKEKQMMPASSPPQPLTDDWSVHAASEASNILPTVPPPGRPRRLQHPTTGGTNDEELQYPPVHSNTAGCVTDRSKVHAINTSQHTQTLMTQPSATARKKVTEEERLVHDAEWYRAA
ncbi:hypothetical protein BDN71DRAFT_1428304 [Pleurotus eryngii]|uniref:Uncharacterized protein n=1 Tax=Pleurotus eryngii TaxID=5323 RepID=A0A9P6A6U9_PLEER|nr:hypothetical protein BDN71DRAFT_1428304 [Pleurotus eryngii]